MTTPDGLPGRGTIRASWICTALLAATDLAAALGPKRLLVPGAVVAIGLFLVGCGVFIGAWVIAANRSRTEVVDLYGLFFLGGSAPKRVQRLLIGSTLAQTVVVVTCATLRPATAAGILAPVAGLALGALWAARHGEFPRRREPEP
jgi:hypothetical protein